MSLAGFLSPLYSFSEPLPPYEGEAMQLAGIQPDCPASL